MKKALRKGSATSDEESVGNLNQQQHQHHGHQHEDENTDTEQHESLPHDQEEEDNKINTQKQSTTGATEKKRDLFPELIKKLRESAKKSRGPEGTSPTATATMRRGNADSTDDEERRVVQERRQSLLRKGARDEAKFDVIDETTGAAKVATTKKGKAKASVFTFDVPQAPQTTETVAAAAAADLQISSSDNDQGRGGGSPKSPIYATVNKVRKNTEGEEKKGKFNSFFTIVKEAVQARRQSLIAEQLDPEQVEDTSLVRRQGVSPKPQLANRDSDCSIWSENIPVITISKTGSDECILEEDRKATSSASPSSNSEGEEVKVVAKEAHDEKLG